MSSEKRPFILAKVAGSGHGKWLSNVIRKGNSLFWLCFYLRCGNMRGFLPSIKDFGQTGFDSDPGTSLYPFRN